MQRENNSIIFGNISEDQINQIMRDAGAFKSGTKEKWLEKSPCAT